jgi:hypothetical protein
MAQGVTTEWEDI